MCENEMLLRAVPSSHAILQKRQRDVWVNVCTDQLDGIATYLEIEGVALLLVITTAVSVNDSSV